MSHSQEVTHLTTPDDYTLRIIEEDGDFTVWLNTDARVFRGCLIGQGRTRQDAVSEAVRVLEWATGELQAPPPDAIRFATDGPDGVR